jgi:hypothetical protein
LYAEGIEELEAVYPHIPEEIQAGNLEVEIDPRRVVLGRLTALR